MTSKYLPESKVLRPRDADLTNSDDWPEFSLSDATIFTLRDELVELESLLLASEHYPLIVRGRLDGLPHDQLPLLLQPDLGLAPRIEIQQVRSFAYGTYDNGDKEIWAAGEAGWFVVKPARQYRSIYNDMIDAINALYFVADFHQSSHRPGKGRKDLASSDQAIGKLFENYGREIAGDAGDAAEKIYKHRDFLLSSMMTGKEGINWDHDPLFLHLQKRFPLDSDRVRRRVFGEAANRKLGSKVSRDAVQKPSDAKGLKRKPGRIAKGTTSDVISLDSSSTTSEQIGSTAAAGRAGKRTVAPEPAPTQTRESRRTPSSSPSQASDSDRRPPQTKSALRLKPSKPMKGPPKGTQRGAKGGKGPARRDQTDDDSHEVGQLLENPQYPPQPGKRKREPALGKDLSRMRRGYSKQNVDEGIDMPTSPSSSEDTSPEHADDAVSTLLQLAPELHGDIMASADPVQEDTWICALDGCTHKVYSASDPESQQLIREHYALHAYDDDQRVKMVKQLAAPFLPVGHLMEKVKMQAHHEGFPGSKVAGTRYPEPLKRKY